VDVGASCGGYAVHLLQHAGSCIAFEARPSAAATFARVLRAVPGSRLRVEAVALSDRSGEAQLRVVTSETGRSTIETENPIALAGIEILTVPMRRLDDYAGVIAPVGCIKIDVEGHEEAVLQGAAAVLRRDHPSLLIEIEERHKRGSIVAVNRFLGELGYRGFFYRGGRLRPIESFNAAVHQDVARLAEKTGGETPYINNFVFLAAGPLARVSHLLER
jgi:FkbM family methyltransferase